MSDATAAPATDPPSHDGQADPLAYARRIAVATYDRLRHGHTVDDALHGALDAYDQALLTTGLLTLPGAPVRPPTAEEIVATAKWLAEKSGHPRMTMIDDAWATLLTSPEQVEFATEQAGRRMAGMQDMTRAVHDARLLLLAHIAGR